MNKFYKLWLPIFIGITMFFFFLFPKPVFATNTGVFTMELWVKPTSSIASQALVGKAEELRMFTDASGNPGCQIKTTSWQTAVTSSTAITLNTWSHIACFYDKTNIKIYLNGVQTGSQALTTVPDDTANTFKIGQDDSTSTPYSNLTGVVDQFQFYNYARSQKQIVADMNAGHPAVGSPVGSAVGYWAFDEGQGTTANNSGSGGSALNGTLTLMASPATSTSGWTQSGKFGKALVFDGINDYITGTPTGLPTGNISASLTAWVKFDATQSSGVPAVFSYGAEAANQMWGMGINNTGFYFLGYSNDLSQAWSYSTGVWYHVTLVTSGTTVRWYANGVQIGSDGTLSNTPNVGSTFFNMSKQRPGNGVYFQGSIDEVKFYNYALTADEVKLDYNRGSSLVLGSASNNSSYQVNAANQEYCIPGDSTSCAAPVGRWDFEEGSGASAFDTSGNANTGTWNGTGATHWKTGKYGKAGNFNGSDDYIGLGQPSNLNFVGQTNAFTIAAWIKTAGSASNNMQIVAKADNSIGQYQLIVLTTGVIAVVVGDTSSRSTTTVNDNNWHHVAVTVPAASTGLQIYIDGKLESFSLGTGGIGTTTNAKDVLIGARRAASNSDSATLFPGQIDDVRIYNYARSAKQINEDMLAGGDSLSNARGVSSSSPVGYWKLDEGYGTTANNSGSGGSALNGTLTLMASPATSTSGWTQSGKFGKALVFDGINDYVQVSDNNALDMSGGVAISAWINLGETPGASLRTILAKDGTWSGTSTNYQLDIRSSGKIEFAYRGSDSSANEYITNSAVITSGSTWYHVVLTYDGTNNPTIYVNGNAQAGAYSSGGNKAITGNAQPLFIGVLGSSGSPSTNYFIGTLDEVKIYNYALTADEVKVEYNRGSSLVLGSLSDNSSYQKGAANQEYCVPGDSTSCAAPVGRWDFEEGSGTSARDTSGNAYTGTLTNGPTWISGKYGKGLNFDGSDDSISTADIDITGGVTIEAWVKTSSTNSQIVVRKTNSYELTIINSSDCAGAVNGSVSLITGTGTTWSCTNSIYFADGTTSVADGKWHHIAGTFDDASDTMRIYVDGILQTTNTGATGTFGTNNNTTYIGRDVDGSAFPFNGSIDQIRLYNYARTAAQVAWDYNRGGPVGWWKMDECQGDKINDSSGNSNTGTVTATSTLGTCNTASTFWGGSGGTGAGKFNYAPTFNGTGDYIDAGGASSLNITTAITITAWIKTSNNTQAQTIIEKTNTTSPWNGYAVNLGSNDSVVCGGYGYLSYWPGNYPTNSWVCSNSSNYNNGNWHHIAIVHSGTTVTFYKDAVSDGTATVGSRTNNSSTNLFIGQNSLSARRFSGQLDDIRIFNYALTAAQIKNEYNGGSVRFGPSTGSP